MGKKIITGYNGCSCHPFSSWDECNKAHKQKLEIGTPVRNRHTGKKGYVHEIGDDYFYIVKYGILPRDNHLEHSAQLIPRKQEPNEPPYEKLVMDESEWVKEHNRKTKEENKARGYA